MKLKKWTALALSAALATCMLTACPWEKDDAASPDLPASSSQPSHDSSGSDDEDDTGNTGGETTVNEYTVTVTIGANGTVTYNGQAYSNITNKTAQVAEGTTITFTVMPEEKYTATVTAGGTTLNPANGVYSYTVNADCNITVKFEDLGYTITTDENGKETYNVHDETGLDAWAEAVRTDSSINCTLTNHITITYDYSGAGSNWQQVGWYGNPSYTGTFDGGGYAITGMDVSTGIAAMFDTIGSGGVVKNLKLLCVEFDGKNGAGGIAEENYGTITGCTVTGTLTVEDGNDASIGGIVVENYGTITDCHFYGKIIENATTQSIGGIAAHDSVPSGISECECSYFYNDEEKPRSNLTAYDY